VFGIGSALPLTPQRKNFSPFEKTPGAKKAKGFVSKGMKVAAALAMKQGNGLADVTEDNDDDDEVDQ
jgi:hypothetical protein